MKNITIAGRLTKDAETRDAGGKRVTGFSVAVDSWTAGGKGTLFFDCSDWRPQGEKVAPHLTKGTPVTVSGDLATRDHNGKTYLTVRVSDVTLQGGKPGARIDDFRDSVPSGVAQGGTRSAAYDLNDDVPF
jgi:single-strand DNA-binding protein